MFKILTVRAASLCLLVAVSSTAHADYTTKAADICAPKASGQSLGYTYPVSSLELLVSFSSDTKKHAKLISDYGIDFPAAVFNILSGVRFRTSGLADTNGKPYTMKGAYNLSFSNCMAAIKRARGG